MGHGEWMPARLLPRGENDAATRAYPGNVSGEFSAENSLFVGQATRPCAGPREARASRNTPLNCAFTAVFRGKLLRETSFPRKTHPGGASRPAWVGDGLGVVISPRSGLLNLPRTVSRTRDVRVAGVTDWTVGRRGA